MRSVVWPVLLILAALLLLAATAVFLFYDTTFTYIGFAALLAGAVWLAFQRHAFAAHGVFAAFTLFALVLKLFTAELSYREDPTSGVIVKPIPSFVSRMTADDDRPRHFLLGPDENGYFGDTVYRPLVAHIWFAIPLVWLGVAAATARRRPRTA